MTASNAQLQSQAKKFENEQTLNEKPDVTNASTKGGDRASQDDRSYLPMEQGCATSRYVFELQAMLMQDGDFEKGKEKSAGYLDGDFGGNTKKAVMNFQAKHGLEQTGIVDAETWDTLKANVDLYENSAKEGLADKSNAEFGTAQNKLTEYASFYNGYLEKDDASALTDPGVGGDQNFTRFGRDYCIATQTGDGFVATYWCNMFVDGVMSEAYGEANAKKMMNGMSALCSQTAQNMGGLQCNKDDTSAKITVTSHDRDKDRTCVLFVEPKVGDFIFFWKDANNVSIRRIGHIGIVKSIDGANLTAVEGNASVTSETNNGGGVCEKVYKNYKSTARIAGFGRPDWSVVQSQFEVDASTINEAEKAEEALNNDTRKDEVVPEVNEEVKAETGKEEAGQGAKEESGEISEEKVWLHAELTDKQITNAKNYNNNTENVGMSERIMIRELVGRPSSKDAFTDEDIQAIADWQLNNNLDPDGQFGGQSLTISAYIDYTKYLNQNGGESDLDPSRQAEMDRILNTIDKKYEVINTIAKQADVPPAMVAAIWYREGSLQDGVYLHNGQPLGQVTDLEPKGILFGKDQFVEAGIHALTTHKTGGIKLLGLKYNTTDLAAMCAYTESYNGWGYRKYHTDQASAYVTAGTGKYSGGKYVADGKYDANFKDEQMGAMPIMSEILKRHPVQGSAQGPALNTTDAPQNASSEHVSDTAAAKEQAEAANKNQGGESQETAELANPHNIDISGAIKYNNGRNKSIIAKIQRYVCAEVTNVFDDQTVLKIADWQASTNGELEVDGKFGDCSYDYAVQHNFDVSDGQSATTNESAEGAAKNESSEELPEGNITAHFKWSEFACQDAARTPVPEEYRAGTKRLCENLEILRAELGGHSVNINSGYRTKAHNSAVNGASDSRHLYGDAADVAVSGVSAADVHAKITELINNGKMEEGGLGSYSTWTHYDVRGSKARW